MNRQFQSQYSQDSSGAVLNPALQTLDGLKRDCKENFVKAWEDCQTDDERQALKVQAEVVMLKLIRGELLLTESLLVLEDVELTECPDDDPAAIDAAFNAFEQSCEQRRKNYEKGLTPDKLKKHADYLQLMNIINKKFKEMAPRSSTSSGHKNNDTQEILDDSQVDEIEAPELDTGPVKELIPTIDPISKQPLMDPVRNSICLHVYGKAQITALILKNKKIRCPQMGCPNRQYIRIQDLIDDPELKEKVRQRTALSQRYESQKAKAKKEKGGNTTTELD